MPTENVVERKLSTLTGWVTAGLCFIIVFAISAMAIMVWQSYRVGENARQLRTVAEQTHESLCAFKQDIENRHQSGEQYLEDHPNGLTAHGEVVITAAQIQQSLDAQSSTLKSLSGLDCS
jgi:hypothetical protein